MRIAFAAGCLLLGCATTHLPGATESAPPVPSITSDDEFADARAEYTALPAGARGRAAWRNALLAYLIPRVQEQLARKADDAVDLYRSACLLWDADELAKPDAPPELARLGGEIARLYAMRGAEEPVVLGLSVQATLDEKKRKEWEERLRWIDEFETGAGGPSRRWSKVIEALEGTVRVWPAPIVIDRLSTLYLERHQALLRAIRRGSKGGATEMVEGQEAGSTHTAYKLAALYLRIGKPERAQDVLGQVADQPGDDPLLRQLIARALKTDKAGDLIDLAKYFIREDPADREVAMRICGNAVLRFPKDPDPRICAAEMAVSTMAARAPLAIRLLGDAVKLAPAERPPVEMLAKLRLLRLQSRLGEERARVDAVLPEAQDLARFVEDKQKQLPGGRPLSPDAADVWLEIGQGYFNAGASAEAEQYIKRSIDMRASWKAFHQMGVLRMKHAQFDDALALYERALAAPSSLRESVDARATVLRDKAEALDRAGRSAEAKAAREAAREAWSQVLSLVQNPGEAARAQIELGRLLYELGRRRDAIDAFEKAIDFAPQRPETYADVIAFLVPRGHLHEALDAYHRALGRADISEYIKVYSSLWVLDLAARQKESPDPLAEQFLRGVEGPKWYDDLARWASGRLTWQQLIGKADTPGKQAEAYFYQAQRLLAGGRTDEARELWRKVLATDMMAFFEFEMADYYLRKGAPGKAPPIPPADRPDKKPVGDAI
ncbi:MAG TPA: tetratricopeptide repeat protein [Polyangia bacterium]|nr:tetratricopeptide repeat protein [Polyangia bacterium]